MNSAAPSNWYPDPHNPSVLRWWDGQSWTEHVQPLSPQATPASSVGEQREEVRELGPSGNKGREAGSRRKIGLFGARAAARDLTEENEALRKILDETGGLEIADLRLRTAEAREELQQITDEIAAGRSELESLQAKVLDVRDGIDVQEFALYDFEHPAEASAKLGAELSEVRLEIRNCIRAKKATSAIKNFTFDNSAAKGRKFVADLSKMMLAAYNAEAENAIKTVRAGGLSTAQARLEKAADRVAKNGSMIGLHITGAYHRLRVRELELAARHLAAVQAAKEAEREHRAELREAKRAEAELQREREKLDKERDHYANALAALVARGDEDGADDLRAKLADVDRAIADVDYRAANVRTGYVYVISNVGSMGEQMVKIGMTRRLDPMDRIKELSDASVPFNFDVHALFFSEDAYGIEAMLHRHFADRRVNRVNLRREFFYATPAEVLAALREHDVAVVEYRLDAEAEEFRASREFSEIAPN